MRVLIDTSYAQRGPSGTAVYVRQLLPALEALGIEVVTAARRRRERGGGGIRSALNLAIENAWTHVELPRRARRAGADVLHHPLPALAARCATPQVVTVHDLAFELLPDCFDRAFGRYAHLDHRRAARHAEAVITPSEATKRDAMRLWGVDAARIVVAPHGPGQAPPSERGAPRWLLFVGDREPRKNLERLIEAHARYAKTERLAALPLALAGRAFGGGADLPVELRQPGRPTLRTNMPLDRLLRNAAALVVPSLHEGFGLTALEALHAGCPVIASDRGALPEVCGEAARYVDPTDVDSIAGALHDLATVPPLRELLRRSGLERAKAFSWRRAAEQHARAYALARQCGSPSSARGASPPPTPASRRPPNSSPSG